MESVLVGPIKLRLRGILNSFFSWGSNPTVARTPSQSPSTSAFVLLDLAGVVFSRSVNSFVIGPSSWY